jgi:7-carboxy-7-deazaguanine synthase
VRIAEIYPSIQGEGLLTGTASVFVRASGCNLRCWFCDTPYASWQPEGEDLSVDEIVGRVVLLGGSHVVLTGGEPMLFAELVPISRQLAQQGYHITIETAGTLELPVACDLMSISPKLANSAPVREDHPQWHARHEKTRWQPGVVASLIAAHSYQLKFVVDRPEDVAAVLEYLAQLPEVDRQRVLLMPQGTAVEQLEQIGCWLEPRCAELGVRFCPRQQIHWFGYRRRT